jgi:hypothetical protein
MSFWQETGAWVRRKGQKSSQLQTREMGRWEFTTVNRGSPFYERDFFALCTRSYYVLFMLGKRFSLCRLKKLSGFKSCS